MDKEPRIKWDGPPKKTCTLGSYPDYSRSGTCLGLKVEISVDIYGREGDGSWRLHVSIEGKMISRGVIVQHVDGMGWKGAMVRAAQYARLEAEARFNDAKRKASKALPEKGN